MQNKWIPWLKGLGMAVLVGVATAVTLGIAGVKKWEDLKGLGFVALVAGIGGASLYLKQSPLPVLLLVAMLTGDACQAQVTVVFTPEPMSVLKALNVKNVGLWGIHACNDGEAAVSIAPERFYMAASGVHFIEPIRAKAVIQDARSRSVKGKVLTYITYGGILATGLTGFGAIAADARTVASIASGTILANQLKQQVETDMPSLDPYLSPGALLTGMMNLAPGACDSRAAFAGKMKNPQPVTAVIKMGK